MCENVIKMRENGAVIGYKFGGKFETSKVKVLECKNCDEKTPVIDSTIKLLYNLEHAGYDFETVKEIASKIVKAYSVVYIAKTTGKVTIAKYNKAVDFLDRVKLLTAMALAVDEVDVCECNAEATNAIKRFREKKSLENYRRAKVYF